MPLPVLVTPTFELTLPSTDQTIKYRPFLVKEEKILLMALEGGDEKEITAAVRQIITNCAVTPIDVDKLATFDIEYFFLRLRAKSIGEIIEIPYRCQNVIIENKTERVCNTIVPLRIDLETIAVFKPENHNPVIMLTESIGVKMRYPRMELLHQVSSARSRETNMESALRLVARCVESVFDATNVYDDASLEETEEFLEGLTQTQFTKIQAFFDTMPVLRHEIQFVCSACQYQETIVLEGMERFFV